MNRFQAFLAVFALTTAAAQSAGLPDPAHPAAPTFQELMDPTLFPNPQMGMKVEQAALEGESIRIRTTGADIDIDMVSGEIQFRQRIVRERLVATLHMRSRLEGAVITHSGPGFTRVTFAKPAMTLRVNGDSLFMLHAHEPLALSVDRNIDVAWHASYLANHLIADERGAFGLFCSDQKHDDHFDPYATTVARYQLPEDAVLWVGVCPPKPYDWKKSLDDNVVWHWSRQSAYPPDEQLQAWREHGNIVLLQAELQLWKDWNLAFVPRHGEAEFARVRKTIHDAGMRFIVYTSPFYFLKGTAHEPKAINTFEGFKGWPPGTKTGENMGLFLPEIRKVMAKYKPDGLYFDGQYIENPAALYALARASRMIVGDDGILEWHSTAALGTGNCFVPHADAYVDFILRGEHRKGRYADFDYLRFFVSGYNIHNSIGVICNNGEVGVYPELAHDVLRANARFHTIVDWFEDAKVMKVLNDDYAAKLTPALRETVEAGINERQALAARKTAEMKATYETLAKPPAWGEPIFRVDFSEKPEAEEVVSEKNPDPFKIADGLLEIKAHANTYAFLRIPLSVEASGFVVRLRQGADGGQSWGPAAMLRWDSSADARLGTRSGGTIQSDIAGVQQHGSTCDPWQWVFIRARWLGNSGVVERSLDGKNYERLWAFEHGGALNLPTKELLIGKVPYDGQAKDHTAIGGVGPCGVDLVEVYGSTASP